MARFIEGEDRSQATLFPERLDDYIGTDNPIRFIEAFVEQLDLDGLGFKRCEPASTGRPGYDAGTLLKIYIYGYLNRIASGRRLERECQRNVELMWLTCRLAPDHKTLCEFRKANSKALIGVCREFVGVCRNLSLFSQALVAIDGSKFKAVNHRDKNFTEKKMKTRQERVERHIARYLAELDEAQEREPPMPEAKAQDLSEKLEALREEMTRLKAYEKQLQAQPDGQLSLTDPDARSMKSAGKGSGLVGYNMQAAVEAKNHFIVSHEVTNIGNDRAQLYKMAQSARRAMQVEPLSVVADMGYYSGRELRDCEQVGLLTYVPKPYTSDQRKKGLYTKDDFIYESDKDRYRCPAGQYLTRHFKSRNNQLVNVVYFASDPICRACPKRPLCTTASTARRIQRWEHEAVVEAVQRRLDEQPKMMQRRRETVEHPFGTLKAWMGATHFVTRTLPRVRAEMSLHVLAYNLRRAINLLGVSALILAVRPG